MDLRLETTVVIPAYNEQARLPSTLRSLAQRIEGGEMRPVVVTEVIVVDDGSTDDTIGAASDAGAGLPGFRVVRNERNRGKGYAIRNGLEHATSPWALVADADESTRWTEARKLGERTADVPSPSILIASRGAPGSHIVTHQSFARESLGRLFNFFVRLVTGLPFKDTQCGFKLVDRRAVATFLPAMEVDGFAWDVELLLHARASGLTTVEVPVDWAHDEDSRIELFRDGFGMLWQVVLVRLRFSQQASAGGRKKKETPRSAD